MEKIILVLSATILVSFSHAQVFAGFGAFEKLIEFEGQRYLMEEIYEIKSTDYDKLKLEKTIQEIDRDEGFMFVLTSYVFNQKSGVVITSFNSTNFGNTSYQFVNVHLTYNEYVLLHNAFLELEKNKLNSNEHVLRSFNDELIIDVHNEYNYILFSLWVNNNNRHTLTKSKWEKAFKRFNNFIEE